MDPVAGSLAVLLAVAYVLHSTQHSPRVSRAQAARVLRLVKCVSTVVKGSPACIRWQADWQWEAETATIMTSLNKKKGAVQ